MRLVRLVSMTHVQVSCEPQKLPVHPALSSCETHPPLSLDATLLAILPSTVHIPVLPFPPLLFQYEHSKVLICSTSDIFLNACLILGTEGRLQNLTLRSAHLLTNLHVCIHLFPILRINGGRLNLTLGSTHLFNLHACLNVCLIIRTEGRLLTA